MPTRPPTLMTARRCLTVATTARATPAPLPRHDGAFRAAIEGVEDARSDWATSMAASSRAAFTTMQVPLRALPREGRRAALHPGHCLIPSQRQRRRRQPGRWRVRSTTRSSTAFPRQAASARVPDERAATSTNRGGRCSTVSSCRSRAPAGRIQLPRRATVRPIRRQRPGPALCLADRRRASGPGSSTNSVARGGVPKHLRSEHRERILALGRRRSYIPIPAGGPISGARTRAGLHDGGLPARPGLPFLTDRAPLTPEQRAAGINLSILNYSPLTRAALVEPAEAWATGDGVTLHRIRPSIAAGRHIADRATMLCPAVRRSSRVALPAPSLSAKSLRAPFVPASMRMAMTSPVSTFLSWQSRSQP